MLEINGLSRFTLWKYLFKVNNKDIKTTADVAPIVGFEHLLGNKVNTILATFNRTWIQRGIENPGEHLLWNYFAKIINDF